MNSSKFPLFILLFFLSFMEAPIKPLFLVRVIVRKALRKLKPYCCSRDGECREIGVDAPHNHSRLLSHILLHYQLRSYNLKLLWQHFRPPFNQYKRMGSLHFQDIRNSGTLGRVLTFLVRKISKFSYEFQLQVIPTPWMLGFML